MKIKGKWEIKATVMGDCLEYTPTKKITQKKNNKNLQESFLKPIME